MSCQVTRGNQDQENGRPSHLLAKSLMRNGEIFKSDLHILKALFLPSFWTWPYLGSKLYSLQHSLWASLKQYFIGCLEPINWQRFYAFAWIVAIALMVASLLAARAF